MDHLSGEIHDNLAQLIALVQANLYLLTDRITNPTETQLVKNINGLVASMANELQNISRGLSGNYIKEIGLINALHKEAGYINDSKKLVCRLDVQECSALSAGSQLLIYRIAQEAMHNVLKHAQATLMQVSLKTTEKCTQLIITDNGKGFNCTGSSPGVGLINMSNRARMLNASLNIISAPGAGTTISLTLKHPIYGKHNNKYRNSR